MQNYMLPSLALVRSITSTKAIVGAFKETQ